MTRQLLRGLAGGGQLQANILSGVATMGGGVVVVAASHALFLRVLGYESYGLWLVLATVQNVAALGNLGIAPAITHVVSKALGRGDDAVVPRAVATAVALLTTSGGLVLAGALFLRGPIAKLLSLAPDQASEFIQLVPWVGAVSLYMLVVQAWLGAVAGLGRIDISNYARLAGRVTALGVSVTLVLAGTGLPGLVVGSVFAHLVPHVVTHRVLVRQIGFRLRDVITFDRDQAGELLRFGVGVAGGSMLNLLLAPFNRLMAAKLGGTALVSVYEVGFSAAMQARGVLSVGLKALMPEVSRRAAEKEHGASSLKKLWSTSNRRVAILGAIVFAAAILLAKPLIVLWVGDKYLSLQVVVLRGFLLACYISLIGAVSYQVLLGLGRVRLCLLGHALQSTLNAAIVLAAFALGFHSLLVVVAGVGLGFVVSNAFLWVAARRTLTASPGHRTIESELAPPAAGELPPAMRQDAARSRR